jgi:heat-inducible transcriptional repressor
MADLEETGYLQQLHTSSGRVPTDRGYRYYVDNLMPVQELPSVERVWIDQEFAQVWSDADDILRQASHILASLSHQTGIVEGPDESNAEVFRIEIVPITPLHMGVMIADSCGHIRTVRIGVESPWPQGDLDKLNRFLNEHLRGVVLDQMVNTIRTRLAAVGDEEKFLAERALDILELIPAHRSAHVFLEGTTQLFEQPEFRDVAKARDLFNLFEERDRLGSMLRLRLEHSDPRRILVLIGSEVQGEGADEIGMVVSPYCVGENSVGVLGVVGPRRMPYPRLTPIVEYTADSLSRSLTRLVGDGVA